MKGQAKGLLTITDTNLILTLQGSKIQWPLENIRRYGCDGHIFFIEAGSQCPAGEGLYAFNTKYPEELFKVDK